MKSGCRRKHIMTSETAAIQIQAGDADSMTFAEYKNIPLVTGCILSGISTDYSAGAEQLCMAIEGDKAGG